MAEQRHSNSNVDAYDDDEFLEQYHEPYEQQHQFGLERETDTHVDSSGSVLKHSTSHYDSSSSGKLFVGGVSWETTEETFSDYFSKFGEIADSVIMMEKQSGRPRGFGFVTFFDPAVADTVLSKDHIIDGRAVEVKRTVPRARSDMNDTWVSRTKKIFVGGLPSSLTEDEFKDYFSSFGSIIEHQIMIDYKTGRSRGFGFITFEKEDAVEKIFSGGETHELGGKQVEIKKAVPKRGTGDYSGNTAKPYGRSGGVSAGYDRSRSGDVYDGKMGRAVGGYGVYGPYGGYGESYCVNYSNFYSGYGYGYGFGYGGPMYMNARYGMNGYGMPAGYGCAVGYGGGGSGSGGLHGYDHGKVHQGSGGSMPERYHPYRN